MNYPIGAIIYFRGKKLERISIDKINTPSLNELNQNRLNTLKNGFDKFSSIIDDPFWNGDPISLESKGENYFIIDGRHRIYLAKQTRLKSVWAFIQ
ncbi:MAG TPA: hypothetical protein PKY82_21805 [Pyrinomonadaceae bacterium]|nr:hypothetical protein [Pyrinomonadaceae bacterium]